MGIARGIAKGISKGMFMTINNEDQIDNNSNKGKLHRLLKLMFSEVHLVRYPANRKPFLLLKSVNNSNDNDDDDDNTGDTDTEMRDGGVDMPNDLLSLELEDYGDLSDLESLVSDSNRSALSKALDIIKTTLGMVSKQDTNRDTEESLVIDRANTKPTDITGGDADGEENTLVNTVSDLVAKSVASWENLPDGIKAAVSDLAKAAQLDIEFPSGEEEVKTKVMEKELNVTSDVTNVEEKIEDVTKEEVVVAEVKPETADANVTVEKSSYELELEATLDKQGKRLEKMEQDLAIAHRTRRIVELDPVSKAVGGFEADDLYTLENLDAALFDKVVKHMGTLQSRAAEAGLFGEVGTSAPGSTASLEDKMDAAAKDRVTKGLSKDYSAALMELSELPEYREIV